MSAKKKPVEKSPKGAPCHGYCMVCNGPIPQGMCWTLTRMMNRVHADPDDCITVLHPRITQAFIRANPGYVSSERY